MPAPRTSIGGGRFSRSALLIGAAVVVTGEFPNPFRACESAVTPAHGGPVVAVYGGPPPPLVIDGGVPAPFAPDASVGAGEADAATPRKDAAKPSR